MNELTPTQIHDLCAAAGRLARVRKEVEIDHHRMAAAIDNVARVIERISPEYIDGWANAKNEPAF